MSLFNKNKEKNKVNKKDIEKIYNKVSLGDKKVVTLDSEKIKNRDRKIRVMKNTLLVIILFLIIIYFLLKLFYLGGAFTIALASGLERNSGIIMYEKLSEKHAKKILKVDQLDWVDNISIDWLPKDIDSQGEGTHNGENYLAYTFYIENKGSDTINYWYKISVDDVVKSVDEAIRVMLFRNDEKTVYAKASARNGEAEKGTEKFVSSTVVCDKKRTDFHPDDIDKYTIVVFIEGDDPECVDSLIGGMMKMHMDFTEEHLKPEDNQVTNENEAAN